MQVLLSEYPNFRVEVLIGALGMMIEQLTEGEIELFIGLHDPSQ